MIRFMVFTFGLLGVAWYQMSGGSEFKAGGTSAVVASPLVRVAPIEQQAAPAEQGAAVILAAAVTSSEAVSSVPARQPAAIVTPTAESATPVAEPVAPQSAVTVTVVEPAMSRKADTEIAIDATPQTVALVGRPQQAVQPEDELFRDIRTVTGTRVNLRTGPGTGFGIQGKLYEGDRVEVVDETSDGWVKIRVVGDTQLGWMADWLMTEPNNG